MTTTIPKKQRAVLLLVKQGFKVTDMAMELQIPITKVYRALDKLKKKGFVKNFVKGKWIITKGGDNSSLMGIGGGEEKGGNFFHSESKNKRHNWIRYHNVQVTIGILKPYPNQWEDTQNGIFFRNQPKDFGNTKYLEMKGYEVTGRIYRKSIVIQLPEIIRETIEEAETDAINTLQRTARLIEQRYQLTLIKDGYLNFRLNKAHYALIHNELAQTYREKKQTLKIYWQDGKLRITIDFSKNNEEGRTPELEATHPIKAPDDGRVIKQFFEELVDNPFYPKEIELFRQHRTLTMEIEAAYAEQIKKHLIVQEATLKTQEETLKTLKAIQEGVYINKAKQLKEDEYSEARKQAEIEAEKEKQGKVMASPMSNSSPASPLSQKDLSRWLR